MDSVTQIVLGAAVGEAVVGKKIGNKAMIIGAIAGTIPDLDVVLRPFQGLVEYLSFHRSFSHSILFALLLPPVFAWLMNKLFPRWQVSFKEWVGLYFLGFFTHALLDCFTTWGTQLFYPFSDYGVAFYSVFVVDPAYTVPFIICLLIAACYKRVHPKRSFFNYLGIGLSTAYLVFTVVAQYSANQVFEASWKQQNISYQDYITKPTPFNAIFWSTTARSDSGFYSGFYSLLAEDKHINYRFIPQRKELLAPYLPNEDLAHLLRITKGYYTVIPAEKGVYINDLRFGEFNGWLPEGGEFVFVYHVWEDGGVLRFEQDDFRKMPDKAYLNAFWKKIKGH